MIETSLQQMCPAVLLHTLQVRIIGLPPKDLGECLQGKVVSFVVSRSSAENGSRHTGQIKV
jgi:hypothetical protein